MQAAYLWNARVEYIRTMTRGAYLHDDGEIEETWFTAGHVDGPVFTPAWARPHHADHPPNGVSALDDGSIGDWWELDERSTWIDLRDVTARGHAAMAWTELDATGVPCRSPHHPATGDAYRWAPILCRMRALDESVTVEEARGALAWAERGSRA